MVISSNPFNKGKVDQEKRDKVMTGDVCARGFALHAEL